MKVVGVHPTGHDVYLVELVSEQPNINWAEITQPELGTSRDLWQVPYDERPLEQPGHWAFFFHFLDLTRPLESECGPLELPAPTPIPDHLADVIYEAPC